MLQRATILMALALVLTPAVGAQEENQGEPEVSATETRATIEFDRAIGDIASQLLITFDTETGAFEVQVNASQDGQALDEGLVLTLDQLVEYQDENANGAYDQGEPVASSYFISDDANATDPTGPLVAGPAAGTVEWEPLVVENVTTDEGLEGHHIKARGQFQPQADLPEIPGVSEGSNNGTVALDLYVFGQPTTYNGTDVGATEVWVDLGILNFPYTQNNTDLALVQDASFDTTDVNRTAAAENLSGALALHHFAGADLQLAYLWPDTATVDNATEPVETTLLANETSQADGNQTHVERTHALSYVRGAEVHHGALLGADLQVLDGDGADDSAIGDTEDVPGATVWAALAATGLAATLTRRRHA